MPIRSLADLRTWAGPEWDEASDEDLVRAYSNASGIEPAKIADSLGMFPGAGGKNAKRLSASVDNYQANLYGLGEEVAGAFKSPAIQDWMAQRRRSNELEAEVASGRARNLGAVDRWADVHGPSDFGDYAVGLGIQSLPYMGEALAGGVATRGLMTGTRAALTAAREAGDIAGAARAARGLNIGSTAGGVAASYPSSVGDVLSGQREQADGATDFGSALMYGVPYAAANAIGLEGALARRTGFRAGIEALDNIPGAMGSLTRMGVAGAKTAATESFGETFQEGMNQLGRMAVDPEEQFLSPAAMERYKESAIGGAVLGGLGGAGVGGWRRAKDPYAPTELLGNQGSLNQPQLGLDPNADYMSGNVSFAEDFGALNPYDLAGSVSAFERGAPMVLDSTQSDLFSGAANPAATGAPITGGQIFTPSDQWVADEERNTDPSLMPGVLPNDQGVAAPKSTTKPATPVAVGTAKTPAGSKPAATAAPKYENEWQQNLHDNWVASGYKDMGFRKKLLSAASPEEAAKLILNRAQTGKTDNLPSMNFLHRVLTGKTVDEVVGEAKATTEAAREQILSAKKDLALTAVKTTARPTIDAVAKQVGVEFNEARDLMNMLVNEKAVARIGNGEFAFIPPEQRPSPVTVIKPDEAQNAAQPAQPAQPVEAVQPAPAAQSQPVPDAGPGPVAPAPVTEQAAAPEGPAVTRKRGAKRVVTPVQPARAFVDQAEPAVVVARGNEEMVPGEVVDAQDTADETTPGEFDNRAMPVVDEEGNAVDTEGEFSSAVGLEEAPDSIDRSEQSGFGEVASAGGSQTNVKDSKTAVGKANATLERIDKLRQEATDLEETDPIAAEKKYAAANALEEKFLKQLGEATKEAKAADEKRKAAEAEKGKPKKIRAVKKAEQPTSTSAAPAAPDTYLTDTEKAGKAWDQHNETSGNVVGTFDQQPDELRSQWTEFFKNGAHSLKDFTQLAEQHYRGEKLEHVDTVTRRSGKVLATNSTTLADLRRSPGVARAEAVLKAARLDHLLLEVTSWEVTTDPDDGGASLRMHDARGGYRLVLGGGLVLPDSHIGYTRHVFTHEVGHIADVGHVGAPGVYSSQPEMRATYDRASGRMTLLGPVVRELYELWRSSPAWRARLDYPFNLNASHISSADQFQKELFAQLFSYYSHPATSADIDRLAPSASAFMKEVYEHIAATKTVRQGTRASPEARGESFFYRDGRPGSGVRGREGFSGRAGDRNDSDPGSQRGRTAWLTNEVENLTARVRNREEEVAEAGLSGEQSTDMLDMPGRAGAAYVNSLPETVRRPAQSVLSTFKDLAKRGVLASSFTEDILDSAKNAFPSARNFGLMMREKFTTRAQHEEKVDKILTEFERLDQVARRQVNSFLYDSTTTGKWGYKLREESDAKIDEAMAERFNKLPAAAQAVVKSVFTHGFVTLQEKRKAIRGAIESEFEPLFSEAEDDKARRELEIQKAEKLKYFDDLFAVAATKPYAPVKRFGDYVVVGKSAQYLDAEARNDVQEMRKLRSQAAHYFVDFAETKGQADALQQAIAPRYSRADAFIKEDEIANITKGDDLLNAFTRIRKIVESELDSADAEKEVRKLNRILTDLYLGTLSEMSARQSENRRLNVALNLETLDMMRSFATQGRADAHFIASLEHNHKITDTLSDMRKEARDTEAPLGTRHERTLILNELMRRYTDSLDHRPQTVAKAINRMTSLWMLALSPSYYLQNLTQTYMMTLPILGARFGYGSSERHIRRAYRELAGLVKSVGPSERMDLSKLPEDVRDDVQKLVARGVIEIGFDQDLGQFRMSGDTRASALWNRVDAKIRGLSQKVEAINRVSAAVAALRLAKANGYSVDGALEFADRTVRTTHGDYSAFNAPRAFNTSAGKIALQFRKFQLIQISLLARLIKDAFGKSPENEKRVARAALKYVLYHTAATGGTVGLPGGALIMAAIGWGLGDEDEPANGEYQLRQLIGDQSIADLLIKGVPAKLGVDISGKVGMGNVFSLFPFADVNLSSRDGYSKTLTAAAGPFLGGLMPKLADSVDYFTRGEYYKSLENALPNGLTNAMRGVRYTTEGVTKKSGDVVISPDEISFTDGLLQGLGLPPMKMVHKQFAQNAAYEYDKFFQERSSQIQREYTKAYRINDVDGISEARRDWEDLQATRTKRGYARQPMSTLFKAPFEQQKREKDTVGGIQFDKGNREFVRQTVGL